VLEQLALLGPLSSPNMASDLKTGVHLGRAALRGALENVKINLDSLRDAGFRERARSRAAALEAQLGEASPVGR